MFIWDQSAGTMTRDGAHVGTGYSGLGLAKNNPAMEAAKGVGPIPCGLWMIGNARDSANTGPVTITLSPMVTTDTHGRGDFRIHGDSIANPGSASHGCIILPRAVREAILRSGDRTLKVVA